MLIYQFPYFTFKSPTFQIKLINLTVNTIKNGQTETELQNNS
jgi:hypothetical protein